MPKSRTSIVLATLLLAGLAGCTEAAPAPAASPAASTAVVSPSASAVVSPPTPSAVSVFPVTASRQGGFAGVDDHAEIAADGSVTLTGGGKPAQKTSLPAASVAELSRLVASPEFTAASGKSGLPACNDGFEYTIATPAATVTVHDCGQPHGEPVDSILAIVTPLFNT
ncbi:hypothetical protein [Actinoplanes sp. NPDC026670]|uniref:hypothetical protein n=1 Tax=Actinoplanes sp. NPDC026670 TaxID=3154700 RepID=UPI0033E7B06E